MVVRHLRSDKEPVGRRNTLSPDSLDSGKRTEIHLLQLGVFERLKVGEIMDVFFTVEIY